MKWIWAILLTVFTVILTPSYAVHSLYIWKEAYADYHQFLFPVMGAGAYFIFWIVYLRGSKSMWGTFQHELTHAIACIICFKKVRGFQATDDSDESGELGSITYDHVGGIRGLFISLAPYFLPIYIITILLIYTFLMPGARPYAAGVLGFAVGYHIISMCEQIHFKQTDLTQYGLPFSLWLVAFLNMIIMSLLLNVYMHGWISGWLFLKDSMTGAFTAGYWVDLNSIYHTTREYVHEWVGN